MAFAVAVPLCSWIIASYVSAVVGRGLESEGKKRSPSAGPSSLNRPDQQLRRRTLTPHGVQSTHICEAVTVGGRRRCARRSRSHHSGSVVLNGGGSAFTQLGFRRSEILGSGKLSFNSKKEVHTATGIAGQATNVALAPAIDKPPVPPRKTDLKRRVVVTGMGVVSSLGHDPDTFYNNLLAGKSGISQIENFDCSDFPTRIAGEIRNFSYDNYINPKMAKRMDKYMWYLLTAGKKSLEDSGLSDLEDLDKSKCGILIGSAMGGMQVFNDAIHALRTNYRRMNPFCIPFAITNMGSAMLAVDLQFMGPNYSISTACATGNYCILEAGRAISEGKADVMLAGGADAAILPIGMGGFVACRALSKRNDEPERASRPWDKGRDGFVMGEGAGVLVLEELEHAKRRGARIYAELLGGSFSCDAHHMTEPHPDGKGVLMAIEQALESSGVSREDINYVNAHGTSTPLGDVQEYKAIMSAFGNNPELKMNSTKSLIGHLLGAAGAVEAVATVMAIKTGRVHPNLNLDNPDDYVDLNKMVGKTEEKMDIKVALSNSFGFGGHNSCIMFGPYKKP